MTLPREVLPGEFYMVTRRCTQRQFLLHPDDETNNAFIYCLAEAANRFGIEVVLPTAMSNHYHAIVFDRYGMLPSFTEHFHKMLAKTMNVIRGRWENFWASEQVCIVRLAKPADVIRKLVYVATNPVKDRLVARVAQWPGVSGLEELFAQRPLRAVRPAKFFRADGPMPESVTLKLVVPPELGETATVLDELQRAVVVAEREFDAERKRDGVSVLGRRAVLRQDWRDSPTSREPRRTPRPILAAQNFWARVEAIFRNRAFIKAYRAARQRWIANEAVSFPAGTYWLHRFANVPVET